MACMHGIHMHNYGAMAQIHVNQYSNVLPPWLKGVGKGTWCICFYVAFYGFQCTYVHKVMAIMVDMQMPMQ